MNPEFVTVLAELASKPGFRPWFFDQNTEVPDNFHRNDRQMLQRSHIDLLERVSARTRVDAIYSKQDRLYSFNQMEKIKDTLGQTSPHNRFSYIDDSFLKPGHFVFLEKRREFLNILTNHLNSF